MTIHCFHADDSEERAHAFPELTPLQHVTTKAEITVPVGLRTSVANAEKRKLLDKREHFLCAGQKKKQKEPEGFKLMRAAMKSLIQTYMIPGVSSEHQDKHVYGLCRSYLTETLFPKCGLMDSQVRNQFRKYFTKRSSGGKKDIPNYVYKGNKVNLDPHLRHKGTPRYDTAAAAAKRKSTQEEDSEDDPLVMTVTSPPLVAQKKPKVAPKKPKEEDSEDDPFVTSPDPPVVAHKKPKVAPKKPKVAPKKPKVAPKKTKVASKKTKVANVLVHSDSDSPYDPEEPDQPVCYKPKKRRSKQKTQSADSAVVPSDEDASAPSPITEKDIGSLYWILGTTEKGKNTWWMGRLEAINHTSGQATLWWLEAVKNHQPYGPWVHSVTAKKRTPLVDDYDLVSLSFCQKVVFDRYDATTMTVTGHNYDLIAGDFWDMTGVKYSEDLAPAAVSHASRKPKKAPKKPEVAPKKKTVTDETDSDGGAAGSESDTDNAVAPANRKEQFYSILMELADKKTKKSSWSAISDEAASLANELSIFCRTKTPKDEVDAHALELLEASKMHSALREYGCLRPKKKRRSSSSISPAAAPSATAAAAPSTPAASPIPTAAAVTPSTPAVATPAASYTATLRFDPKTPPLNAKNPPLVSPSYYAHGDQRTPPPTSPRSPTTPPSSSWVQHESPPSC
jgi:hypothetical protein